MKSADVFSIVCGAIFGVCLVLLFNRQTRASIVGRSLWLRANPYVYVLIVASSALAVLAMAYVVVTRFA